VFWLETVDGFRKENEDRSLAENTNRLVNEFPKDYPLNFYSRERLFSDEARSRYIKPEGLE
jgi:hypothetical protein